LPKSREKILALLRIHPEYTTAILAKEIGVTAKAIEKQLAILKKESLLTREGSDRKGRWVVAKSKTSCFTLYASLNER